MADDRTRIEQALREAGEYVARMASTPGKRELTARLETFRRAVESWDAVQRPTPEHVEALIESVNEVRRLATDRSPTVRRRPITD